MTDPFEALRAPVVPTDPDPVFAARLRARVLAALESRGATMPTTTPQLDRTTAPASTSGIVPYLAVADARGAMAWYAEALGAEPRGEPIVMPDGRVGHAELELAGHLLMLADEYPEAGVVAPQPGEAASVTLHLTVADVDGLVARAVDAGAELERPPADHPYGRNAVVRDPFGHRWLVASAPATVPPEDRARPPSHDVVYASLWVPDVERAAAFFGAVLGWTYAPGGSARGRQVEGVSPRHGLWGGEERSTLFLCFAVDDVSAAVERVRAAGGRAAAPRDEPYGMVADCVDDEGMAFAVVQPRHGRPAPSGGRPGDLEYITVEVADSARARAFYGAVLGWRFSPGRSPDGWGVDGVLPMVGLIGGQERSTVVPMYRVADIGAAVERVRAAGGAATDPERQPYGVTSSCTDDQGTRFYLGQL